MCTEWLKFRGSVCTFPAEVKQGDPLPSLSGSQIINQGPLCSLCSATLLALILCFCLVILLFKMTPTCHTEVLSSVSEHKEAGMYLMEKIHVLDKFYFGMSYGAVGPEFNVKELTVHIT